MSKLFKNLNIEIISPSTPFLNPAEIAKIRYDHFQKNKHKLLVKDILGACKDYQVSAVDDAMHTINKFL